MPFIDYKWLRFQNGYAYRECELSFENQGLVLVRGLNLDDGGFLGAGKTSPFEVFSLLQTGRVGKQRKGERILADDVINLSVGEGFEARLRFEVDGEPFEIVQCRAHPKFGNAYRIVDVNSGQNLLPNNSRKKPQPWVLKEILKLDDKSFFNLVYMAQDFSNVMLSGTDGDRQQNLIQMFGLDAYDKLLDRTKKKLSALRATAQDMEQLQQELGDLETELKEFPESIEVVATRLSTKQAEQISLQQQHDSALTQQEDLQERLRGLEIRSRYIQEVKKLWGRNKDLPVESVRDVDGAVVDALAEKQTEAEAEVLETSNALRLIDQRKIIEARLQKIGSCDVDEITQELDNVKTELRKLVSQELPKAEQRVEIIQDLRKLQKPLQSAKQFEDELERARGERHALEKDLSAAKAALEAEVCPTCGRAFEDGDHDADELNRKITSLQEQLKTASSSVHDLSADASNARQHESLTKRLKKLGTSLSPKDIQKEINRHTREERRLTGLLESENLRATLEQQLADLPEASKQELEQRKEAAAKRKKKLTRQHDSAVRILEKLDQIQRLPKGKVSDVKKRLIEAGRTIREAAASLVSLGSDIGALERTKERLTNLTARRDKIRRGLQKTKRTQTDIQCLKGLELAFGPKGLKRERFAAILQDATQQTVPYYTKLLWPKHNVEIQMVEKGSSLKFDLCRGGELVTGSRMLSGGERNKAGLALLFGMRDLKEKYAGLRTNLLIVDEPFGNLDQYGTDCLLRVLRDLKERFGTVLVIGNQQDVLTSDQWDQTWWAVRQNNEAKLYRNGLPERFQQEAQRYTKQLL